MRVFIKDFYEQFKNLPEPVLNFISTFTSTLLAGIISALIAILIFNKQKNLERRKVRVVEIQEYLKVLERIWRDIVIADQKVKDGIKSFKNKGTFDKNQFVLAYKYLVKSVEILDKVDERFIPQSIFAVFWNMRSGVNRCKDMVYQLLENGYVVVDQYKIELNEAIEDLEIEIQCVIEAFDKMSQISGKLYEEIEKEDFAIQQPKRSMLKEYLKKLLKER